jgi:hypothetical protein
MAITIVTTAGDASANSYVSVAEADAYFEARIDSQPWEAADEVDAEQKKRLLVSAARRINQINLIGRKASTTQALAFPRMGGMRIRLLNPESWGSFRSLDGEAYDLDEIPQAIKDAQCELALYFAEFGLDADSSLPVKSITGGGIRLDYTGGGSGSTLPGSVQRLLSPFMQGTRLVRG